MDSKNKERQYILVYPESHRHLGLFEDLYGTKNVELIVAKQKKPYNRLLRVLKRLHLSWTVNKRLPLPFREIWYEKIQFNIKSSVNYCIIVVDAALKTLKPEYLNKIFSQKNVRGVLILVNSMEAKSVAILESKKKFSKVNWESIYSFDFQDVKKYGFKELGYCYYSKHDIEKVRLLYPDESGSDVYFTGTIKGGREALVLSVFDKLFRNGVSCDFNIMLTGGRRLKKREYRDNINYYTGGWIPYEKVLAGVLNSNVIVEIMQEGQSGPSIRYYEAVCYNKKLLTNNPNISRFPYYNPNYMKIFITAEDIDISWLKRKMTVEYHYKGDFSPVHLLDAVLE